MSAARSFTVNYDPLVSDTACHTRAPYLVYLSRIGEASQTAAEKEFLKDCRLLTQTQNKSYDKLGMIIVEDTDNTKIPADYLPATASKTKKNALLGSTKSRVAQTTLGFLKANCSELDLGDSQEVFTFSIPRDGEKIPVLPLYFSSKMMLHYAAKVAIPIVVQLRRLSLQGDSFFLDGAVSVSYAFDTSRKKFMPKKIEEDQEVIAIDAVSCYVKGKEDETSGFLAGEKFQTFMEAFIKEDLARLVMISATGHCQYPPSAKATKDSKPNYLQEEKLDSSASTSTSSSELEIDLNSCSPDEYRRLSSLARRYGFFRDSARYAAVNKKEGRLIRTNTCLPFFIDHVHASTLNSCKTTMEGLQKEVGTMKLAQEEKLEFSGPKQ